MPERKIRCDHSLPYYGRFRHRKQTDSFLYHPAPMSYLTDTTSAQLLHPQKLPAVTDDNRESDPDITFERISVFALSCTTIDFRRRPADIFRCPYGATEFLATFSEDESHFMPEMINLPEDVRKVPSIFGQRKNTFTCVKALRKFLCEQTCERLLETAPSMYSILFLQPMIALCLRSFWSHFRP